MPRSRPIVAGDLPNFFDFSPDEENFTCISLAPSKGRRCSLYFGVDRSEARKLRASIIVSPKDDEIGRYILLCCCTKIYPTQPSHRSKVSDPDLLNQIIRRYKRELACPRNRLSVESRNVLEAPSTSAFQAGLTGASINNTMQSQRHRTISNQQTNISPAIISTETSTRGTLNSIDVPPRVEPTRVTRRTAANGERAHHIPPIPTTPFVPYQSTTALSLLDTLSQTLTTNQRQSGSIYCLSRTSDPDYYKVGCTGVSVSSRRSALQKCSGPNNHVTAEYQVSTTNAFRAERLLQIELNRYRRRELRCLDFPNCVKRHQEWFEVDLQVIKRIMYRWARWMSEGMPYDAEGRLKDVWMERCRKMVSDGGIITSEALVEMILPTDCTNGQEDSTSSGHDECPICFDELEHPAVTVCGHQFCAGCIARVFERQNCCPLCRANLVEAVQVSTS